MKRITSFGIVLVLLVGLWYRVSAQVTQTSLAQPIAGWEMMSVEGQGTYNGQVVARCSAGKKILGGGYRLMGSTEVKVWVNSPLADQSGWVLSWTGTSAVMRAVVTAICAKA